MINDRNSLFRSSRSELKFSARLLAQAPLRGSQRPPNRLDPAFRLFRASTVSDNVVLCQNSIILNTGILAHRVSARGQPQRSSTLSLSRSQPPCSAPP